MASPELQPGQRDHVVHAVRTFLLAVFLNERLLESQADRFQCKLALLLHDVGYPLEVASRIAEPFGNKVNKIATEIGVSIAPVRFVAPRFATLEQLTDDKNGLDLIQGRLQEWSIHLDVRAVYEQCANREKVCHGVISALAVLRVFDMLYKKHNPSRKRKRSLRDSVDWNQELFEKHSVSACAAMYLHNLGKEWFTGNKIERQRAPLAFLLRVADTLQEWERPSGENPDGLPPSSFDIEVQGGRFVFTANISKERKAKIQDEIRATVEADDIEIK